MKRGWARSAGPANLADGQTLSLSNCIATKLITRFTAV